MRVASSIPRVRERTKMAEEVHGLFVVKNNNTKSGVWQHFALKATENGSVIENEQDRDSVVKASLPRQATPLISINTYENTTQQSMPRQRRFPDLAHLAKKYLCICGTSVPSERTFSTAGHIASHTRGRLLPENVSKLLLVHVIDRDEKTLLEPHPRPQLLSSTHKERSNRFANPKIS